LILIYIPRCLEELKKIFQEKNLDYSEIDKMLIKFNPHRNFDYLFLIDASYSMTGLKIQNAIATIKYIFNQHIKSDDKVGYMFFNDKPYTVFHMTYKSTNEVQLENYIGRIPEYYLEF